MSFLLFQVTMLSGEKEYAECSETYEKAGWLTLVLKGLKIAVLKVYFIEPEQQVPGISHTRYVHLHIWTPLPLFQSVKGLLRLCVCVRCI